MSSNAPEQYDFFLSRRGSVSAVAREVADVLKEKNYRVLVQDYDMPLGASFIEAMDDAIRNSRDLIILYTRDYKRSAYTRKEFSSFQAQALGSAELRHIIVLRCEDVPLEGLLADNVYQDLVDVTDPEERKRRIVAAAERQSQAAPPPPRPFIGVPPCIASFTGRSEELDKLDAILMHDKPAAVTQAVRRVAVQGMGGIGKTSLAVEYAHRYRGLYSGVFWCPAETREGLLRALAGLGITLGSATADDHDVEKAAKVALRLLVEQRADWLMIYDNVSSPDEIAEFLPSGGARALITSRFSDWGELADEIALDVLPAEQAIALLQTRAKRSDPSGAKALAEALGYLPLALDHAAAYCKRTQMRFSDYAAKAAKLIDEAPRGAGYPRSVATTFDIAIAEATSQCSPAAEMMAYLAQCAAERIPMLLVAGAIDDDDKRNQALAMLAEVSLIRHDPFEDKTPAITVHRLVQTIARARSVANGLAQSAIKRITQRLDAIYPNDAQHSALSPLSRQLMPHLFVRSRSLWPRAAGAGSPPQGSSFMKRLISKLAGRYLSRPSIVASERQLAVMFCDICGSTTISGQLSPIEIVEYLSEFQDLCSDAITKFNGTVARVIGDSVLAYFGYPDDTEYAKRSIYAGLELIQRLELSNRDKNNSNMQLGAQHYRPIDVRISIASGASILGERTTTRGEERILVGDTQNLAARLQSFAPRNGLVVDERTWLLAKGFNYEELSPVLIKGRAQEMRVFLVTGMGRA